MKKIKDLNHRVIFLSLLKETRVCSGYTQATLAKKLRQPQSFISKYESGERRLDVLELRKICSVLGVKLPDFIKQLESKLR